MFPPAALNPNPRKRPGSSSVNPGFQDPAPPMAPILPPQYGTGPPGQTSTHWSQPQYQSHYPPEPASSQASQLGMGLHLFSQEELVQQNKKAKGGGGGGATAGATPRSRKYVPRGCSPAAASLGGVLDMAWC